MSKVQLPLLYDFVFPNGMVANALQTELAMVNYLFSLNTTSRYTTNGFFEQSLPTGSDYSTPTTFMFGKSYGTWPNSAPGSHLEGGPCIDLVDVHNDSIYFGRRKYKKYIYPIKVSPHLDVFSGAAFNDTKIVGNFFWKYMSTEALEDVKSGRALILLDYAQENFVPYQTFVNLHTAIEYSGIPREQIVLAFNTFNAEEVYNDWFPEEQRKLTVKSWPFVISNTSYFYSQTRDGRTEPEQFLASRNTIRPNHFLFKVRRAREHRQALIYAMNESGILDKGDWSWLSNVKFEDHFWHQYTTTYGLELDKDKMQALYERLPKSLQDEPGDTFDTVSSWTDNQVKSYNNAYFYICTETYTDGPYKSVTEKICKPIGNYMPFVFSSFPGALQLLRDMGFKTFNGFIDESYDLEKDTVRRVKMIYKEIEKLCKMSREELHTWYWSMEDILIHNREHLLTLYKTDKTTESFIKFLEDRVK